MRAATADTVPALVRRHAFRDDDAEPLRVPMASMDHATRNYRIEDQTEVFHYETTWDGNWKLSAENSMEYYHIGLHARTAGIQMSDSDRARRRAPIRPTTSSRRRRG